MSTISWKNNERQWAKDLQTFGVEAERISRAGNYSVSIHDIDIKAAPWIKSDAKYSEKNFKVNRLFNETEFKYCKEKEDTVVLLTKGYKERGQCATVDSRFLAMLLSFYLGCGTKEDLWKIYLKEVKNEKSE